MKHLAPVLFLLAAPASADVKPNILLILADDMGHGDLGCTGSEAIRTPNLDALAGAGVLCTRAYVASPVCSPSRAGLLTGRDPRRFGYEGNLNEAGDACATRPELLGLPPGEHTLGDHLRAAGYRTGLVGKWHLGSGPGFHPNERGFDHFCGMLGGGHTYFPRKHGSRIERNGKPVDDFPSPYLTDFFTDEAISWIGGDADKPWFLYLSYNAPHTPMEATEADLGRFAHITDTKRRTYAAMVWALDRGIGRLVAALRESGQLDHTLIVFLSDNGGATNNSSWNGPLSGAKGCLREGGVRVPMIVSWPARSGPPPPGNPRSHHEVVPSLDLLPTFLAAAGAKPLSARGPLAHEDPRNHRRFAKEFGDYDGIDLLPQLFAGAPAPARRLFWRLQGQAAVLDGTEKFIRLNHRPAQLFRPATDAGEQTDLAASDPARLREMFEQLGGWEAMLPTVPLWGSSPVWDANSAKIYDTWPPRPEPGR